MADGTVPGPHQPRAPGARRGGQPQPPRVEELTQELQGFLRQRVELLDVRTTTNLLASYGRLDDMMQFASYRQVRVLVPGCRW